MTLRSFENDHADMIALADSILELAAVPEDEAMTQLQSRRVELSRTVASHCTAEIAHIQRLGKDRQTDPAKQALLRKYHSDLLAWRGTLMECNASWPTRRIAQERQEFCSVFATIKDQLVARVRWEEREFYPAIIGATAPR